MGLWGSPIRRALCPTRVPHCYPFLVLTTLPQGVSARNSGGDRYLLHWTGGKCSEQGPLWTGSMEELLRPGVSSARDVPSPELRLHARARTSTVALSSLGTVVVPVPGSRSGLVRGNLGLAQLGSRCRKLKRQEKEGQVEKTTREGRKGGRETNAPGCCTRPTRTACAGTVTSSPELRAFSGCQRMENDLRGGDWASPPDLNLSDKTRAFSEEKKKATQQARWVPASEGGVWWREFESC